MRLTQQADLLPEQEVVIAKAPGSSLSVYGRAGTGKTTTAIYRLVRQIIGDPDGRRVTLVTAFNHMTLYYIRQILSEQLNNQSDLVKIADATSERKLELSVDNAFKDISSHSTVIICTNHILAMLLEKTPTKHFNFLVNRAHNQVGNSFTVQLVFDEAQSISDKYIERIQQAFPNGGNFEIIRDFYFDPNQVFESLPSHDQNEVGGIDRTWFEPEISRKKLESLPNNSLTELKTNHRNTNEIAALVDHLSLKLRLPSSGSKGDRIDRSGDKPQIEVWPSMHVDSDPADEEKLKRIGDICALNANLSIGIVVLSGKGVDRNRTGIFSDSQQLAHALKVNQKLKSRIIQYDSSVGADIRSQPLKRNGIWVMSARSARGLEFDSVIVPNAVMTKMPSRQLVRELYTAVSRPTSNLYMFTNVDSKKVLVGENGLVSDHLVKVIEQSSVGQSEAGVDVEELPW
jgi:hypothetical protein